MIRRNYKWLCMYNELIIYNLVEDERALYYYGRL